MKRSTTQLQIKNDRQTLIDWYRSVKRDLPWRINRDPYRIWVSEVMLQQTTVAAVVPFYERFMKRFPSLKNLAEAELADVLEHWAGLGYYSRARNLHRAAQSLHQGQEGFPRSYLELLELPGFGPYTARAVASLAFDERTGVLDGNVIRVLSRRYGIEAEWWKPQGRNILQDLSDQLANCDSPADLNQGLMELGATVCTPQAPACLLCPWVKSCVARKERTIESLPLKKPRREREFWSWQPKVIEKRGRIFLIENDYAPFLKGHWILPGQVKQLKNVPTKFDYKGTVTHHDIFVTIEKPRTGKPPANDVTNRVSGKWISISSLKGEVPSSLVRKAVDLALEAQNSKGSQ